MHRHPPSISSHARHARQDRASCSHDLRLLQELLLLRLRRPRRESIGVNNCRRRQVARSRQHLHALQLCGEKLERAEPPRRRLETASLPRKKVSACQG